MAKKSVSTLSALLNLDSSGFTAGLAKANLDAKKFKKDLAGNGSDFGMGNLVKGALGAVAAIASVSVAYGKLHAASEALEKIDTASRQLQINPESFQRMAYISKQTGVEIEELTKSVGKMPKLLGEAVTKGSPMEGVFKRLNLNAQELQNLSPEQGFNKVITALQGVDNASERAMLNMEIFGKSGNALLPLMAEDMDELSSTAERLGLIISQDGVNGAKIMGDSFADLEAQGDATFQNIMVGIAPLGTEFARMASGFIEDMGGPIGISQTFMNVIGTIGDVGHDIFYGLKTALLAVNVAIVGIIEGIIKSVEWMIAQQVKGLNFLIEKASKAKELVGGEPIKFRIEAPSLGGNFLGEVRKELTEDMKKTADEIGKTTVSDYIAKLTDAHKKEARALSDKQNKINSLHGAYDGIGEKIERNTEKLKAEKNAIDALTQSFKSMTLADIASKGGNSTNARHAKEAQELYKKADEAEARGNVNEAERLRKKAEKKESSVTKVYRDEDGNVQQVRGKGKEDGISNTHDRDIKQDIIKDKSSFVDDALNFGKNLIGNDTLSKVKTAWDVSGKIQNAKEGEMNLSQIVDILKELKGAIGAQ